MQYYISITTASTKIYQSLLQLQVHSTTNSANNNKKVIFFTSVAW